MGKFEKGIYLKWKITWKITKRFDVSGIPILKKNLVNGKKSGTHIYWFQKPLIHLDYEPESSDGDLIPHLWLYLHDLRQKSSS